jgi:hypothetical protein
LILVLGLSSCAGLIPYKPKVTLPVQEYLFTKKFKFERMADLRPASDTIKEKGFLPLRLVAPTKFNFKGDLSNDIKAAISEGFKSTKFVQISENDDFDFKINGDFSHFYIKEAMTDIFLLSVISYYGIFLNLFGIPAKKEDVSVQIRFNVLTKQNVLLGTYSGSYIKKRTYSMIGFSLKQLEDGYGSSQEKLNTYFSQAVMDIQRQMIADSLKYR